MKLPFNNEQHVGILGRICVVAFGISFAALIVYFDHIWGFISKLLDLASPFILGFGLAFLLVPVQRQMEKILQKTCFRRKDRPKLKRAIATVLAILLAFLLVYVMLRILLPQVIRSITSIVQFVSAMLKDKSSQLNQILLKWDFLHFDGDELVVAWENIVSTYISNIAMLLDNLVLISKTIVGVFIDLLVSVITAFYILIDKDRLCAQIKKIGYSLLPKEKNESLIFWTREANRLFAGFITGKIIDSAIIGVICYFGMIIFKMEYPLLISLVIGVTNIIPFFGPFIGWAPCALILLLVNPISALWFSIFILFLQQLDGNVIGPHILGDYVGVSALSIMIAIVIGGGLFGFAGMLVSVPVYALIYAIIRTWIYGRLKKKDMSINTGDYVHAPEKLEPYSEGERK